MAALVVSAVLTQASTARAYEPYDPYPWCAVSSGRGGGTNCGFLTIEQCMATVSGIGGFCEPNGFYNPRQSAQRGKRRG